MVGMTASEAALGKTVKSKRKLCGVDIQWWYHFKGQFQSEMTRSGLKEVFAQENCTFNLPPNNHSQKLIYIYIYVKKTRERFTPHSASYINAKTREETRGRRPIQWKVPNSSVHFVIPHLPTGWKNRDLMVTLGLKMIPLKKRRNKT